MVNPLLREVGPSINVTLAMMGDNPSAAKAGKSARVQAHRS
jgi:hypothetical protein